MSTLGYKYSEESKKKMSLAKLGKKRKPFSEKTKRIISKNHAMFWLGRKQSEEHKKKISKAISGRSISEETRRKISEWNTFNPNRKFHNTSIEVKLQQLLRDAGIEFETNYPILGRPDIFIKPNICIFADGCYWHKCPECGFEESIKKEIEKDKRITQELQKQDYLVIRLWEHEIKNMTTLGI